tara:strand:- start:446 stop:1120 length:675 start_codon:yes stop_codon:yes gene_type:complete
MTQQTTGLPDYRPLELMLNDVITDVEFDDFIGIWHNFMPPHLCKRIIEYADTVYESGCRYDGASSLSDQEEIVVDSSTWYKGDLNRKDFAFLLNYANREIVSQVNSVLKSCATHYVHKYQALKNSSMVSTDIKVQKTPPGGGYHLWHHENADIAHANRDLVWMIYLNDMPDGEAETEFLYQRRRIKPTAGTVVLWPAGFTHTHKGNTVLTQDKYILTGWYIKAS